MPFTLNPSSLPMTAQLLTKKKDLVEKLALTLLEKEVRSRMLYKHEIFAASSLACYPE